MKALVFVLSVASSLVACKKEAPSPPSSAAAPAATGTPGARPAWYPAGFPLPAGWRLEGPTTATPHATTAPLAWDRSLAEVTADFQKEATAAGWTLASEQPRGMGGKRYRWQKGNESVQVSLFEAAGKARAIVVPPLRFGPRPQP